MKKLFSLLLTLVVSGIPASVHGDVFPSTWTGYVYVEGDGGVGLSIPSQAAWRPSMNLYLGAWIKMLEAARDAV